MSDNHRFGEVLARMIRDDDEDPEAVLSHVVRTAHRRKERRRHALVGITVTASVVAVTALGVGSLVRETRDTGLAVSPGSGDAAALCIGTQSLEELLADSDSFYDAAFVGEVSAIDSAVTGGTGADGIYPRGEYLPVTFSVSQTLKGDDVPATAIVMVAAYDNEDEVEFEAGREYVVVAHTNADGTYSTNACVPTGPVSPTTSP